MPFVITGLPRARRNKSDSTVLVLSYCDSIKLMIIYDRILSSSSFLQTLTHTHRVELELFTLLFGICTKGVEINIYTAHDTTYLLNKFI